MKISAEKNQKRSNRREKPPATPELRFKPVVFRPEILCGTTADYEEKPIRALLDFLMFFEADGTQTKEFAGRKLEHIPPHILAFIVQRLLRFADPKKPISLEEAFGGITGKQRLKLLNERRNRQIIMEIWFHPKRIRALERPGLESGKTKKTLKLTANEAKELADKYSLSEDAIRRIAAKPFFKS
jgi:hypothetical protein